MGLSAHEATKGVWLGKQVNSLYIYTNPASSHITLQLPHTAVASMPAQIDIYNIHGQQVLSHPVSAGQTQIYLSLPPLPKGIYMVHLKGEKNLSAKLVIE